jgi:hypothetical protein
MHKILTGALIGLLVAGCTQKAELTEGSKGRHFTCTDFRDGDVFRYSTDTITNVRMGIGTDSSFDLVDETGKSRTLKTSMEAYVKCVEQ